MLSEGLMVICYIMDGEAIVLHQVCRSWLEQTCRIDMWISLGLYYHCYYIDPVACVNGDIQIVGGNKVVELCVYGDWYPLCGDGNGWNVNDAEVVCRTLGENPEG